MVLIAYTKQGEPFLVSLAAIPLLDEHGKPTCCRWTLQTNPDNSLGIGAAVIAPQLPSAFATASALAAAAAVAARTGGMGGMGGLGRFGGVSGMRPEDQLSAALMMGATASIGPSTLNSAALVHARLPGAAAAALSGLWRQPGLGTSLGGALADPMGAPWWTPSGARWSAPWAASSAVP